MSTHFGTNIMMLPFTRFFKFRALKRCSSGLSRRNSFAWNTSNGGVAANLDAHLEAQCKQSEFDSHCTDSPLSVAVGLIVRQELTGRELPSTAEKVVKLRRCAQQRRRAH